MSFDVGFSETPVVRDGITSVGTYVILAAKAADEYNCVVIGNGNLKFYPSIKFWGMTIPEVEKITGQDVYGRTMGGYEGIHNVSEDAILSVLTELRSKQGAVVVPPSLYHGRNGLKRDVVGSRYKHPATHNVPKEKEFPKYDSIRVSRH